MFTYEEDYLALQELLKQGSPEAFRSGIVPPPQSWKETPRVNRQITQGQLSWGDILSHIPPPELWLECSCELYISMTATATELLVWPPSIILNVVKDDYQMRLHASL